MLNLALVCLRQGKTSECHDLLAAIKADSLPVDSHYSLRASAYFVKGLAALFAGKYHEARGLLRETLKMANQEDLHRLIACSLVVLGQTFMNMGNLTEAQNMLKPAIRVANCIPDISVQLWSASLLKDMYSLLANRSEEENWKNMHGHYSQVKKGFIRMVRNWSSYNYCYFCISRVLLLITSTPAPNRSTS